MAKTKKTFPKNIYVGVEYDKNSDYLVADRVPDSLAMDDAGEREIAIYQFVRLAKVKTKIEVV